MDVFAENLKRRAKELQLSHAEVARRLDLSERRYAHYVNGRNEPNYALLLRIADVLQITPNALLGVEDTTKDASSRKRLLDRLGAVAAVMTDDDLEVAIEQAEAVVAFRRRSLS